MNLSTFVLRQKTFVIFFTLLCTLVGLVSYFQLGKLEDPAFTVKSAVIVTLYPGADAGEVVIDSKSPNVTRLPRKPVVFAFAMLLPITSR